MAANLWDDLDDSQKAQLVNLAVEGKAKTPENLNRVRQQFAENPTYTDKFAREAGFLTPDGDVIPEEENDIEKNVDEALESEESTVDTVPPPQEGEDINDYYKRIRQRNGSASIRGTAPTREQVRD